MTKINPVKAASPEREAVAGVIRSRIASWIYDHPMKPMDAQTRELISSVADSLADAVLSLPVQSVEGVPGVWPGVAAEDRPHLTRADMEETWEAMATIADEAEHDLVEVESAMLRMIIRSARTAPPKPSEAPTYDIDSFADIYAKPVETHAMGWKITEEMGSAIEWWGVVHSDPDLSHEIEPANKRLLAALSTTTSTEGAE